MNSLLIFVTAFSICAALELNPYIAGSGRIYNGRNANPGAFKFAALLEAQGNNSDTISCGGALISPDYVLTAAQCTLLYIKVLIKIKLGLVDSRSNQDAVETSASQVFVHPQYDPRTLANDIAVLRLRSSVQTSARVGPIALPTASQAGPNTYDDKNAVAVGWGQTRNSETGQHPLLQYSRMRVASRAYCMDTLRNYNFNSGQLCSDRTFNAGPCKGDTGGALAYYGPNNAPPVLIGVTSRVIGSCESSSGTVYTYTGHYLKFINSVTGLKAAQ